MTRRHASVAAALAALCAAFAVLVQFQPIGSPWWTGGDDDSVYLSSGVSLAGGRVSRYFDHPGTPIQEALAATLTVGWVVDTKGQSRSERADARFAHLDSTRPYFRSWAVALTLLSVLTAFTVLLLLTGSAFYALLSGLLFLAAPQVIAYTIDLRPDVVLAALCLAVTGIAVAAYRRRSAGLYLAASTLLGFTITVKLHAIGLIVPLGLAMLLHPPAAGWAAGTTASLRDALRRHRRWFAGAGAAWVALLILLNLGSATPNARNSAELLAALAAVVIGAAAVWRLARGTRAAGVLSVGAAALVCAITGAILPNLFYASTVPTMVRWIVLGLIGRGVNSDASPLSSGLGGLEPWIPFFVLAALGALRGLRAREGETLLWLTGAIVTGVLAAARFGTLHYFEPAVALSIPLILRLVGKPSRRTIPVAALIVAALVVIPFRDGIRSGQQLDRSSAQTAALEHWTRAHLAADEGAITPLATSDTSYFGYILQFATRPPAIDLRLLPADASGIAYLKEHGLKLRYLVDPNGAAHLDAIGLTGRFRPIPGVVGVFELR